MQTLRRVLHTLSRLPHGHPADGRPLGLGLATALQAEHDRAERRLEPTRLEAAGCGAEAGAVHAPREVSRAA